MDPLAPAPCSTPPASSGSLERLPLFCDLLTHVVLSLLCRLYAEEPRWAHDALRFRGQLTSLLTAVARGVATPRSR